MTNQRTITLRILLGVALSASSAGMLILAFPPGNLWFLAWVAMVPMLVAQYRILPAKVSSLASAIFNGGWLWGYLGPVFAGSGTFMTYLPIIVFVIALLTDRGARTFNERTRYRWFVPYGIANWVGIEMVRIFLPIAGTWGFIAYTQHGLSWLIQPASIFGIFGMSALLVLVNYALGLAAMAAFDQRWPLFGRSEDSGKGRGEGNPEARSRHMTAAGPGHRRARRWLLGAAGGLAAWVLLSLILLQQPATSTVRVAAIQPGASAIVAAMQGQEDVVAAVNERLVGQTRQAMDEGARFVVWPEGGMPFDPQVDDRLNLRTLASDGEAYLALGYVVMQDEGMRNEATVLSPEGVFLGTFGKDHPVTFGGETSLTRGTYPVYDTPLGTLGTIICYDLDFTDTARKLARQGAQLIAVPSNDWPAITYKHYTHLVFRAVENRVAMVKADGSHDSAIIDAYGRVIALATEPEGDAATLVADVPMGTANAPAIFLGDWIGWLALAGLAFFTFGSGWLARRAEKARTNEAPGH